MKTYRLRPRLTPVFRLHSAAEWNCERFFFWFCSPFYEICNKWKYDFHKMLLFLLIYSGYWWWKAWVVLQNPEHNLYFCNEIKGLTAATALLVSCKLNSNPHRQIRHHWVLPVCLQCVSEFCICSEAITDVKWELLLIPCWFLFHLKVNINPVEWNRKSFSAPGLRNKMR